MQSQINNRNIIYVKKSVPFGVVIIYVGTSCYVPVLVAVQAGKDCCLLLLVGAQYASASKCLPLLQVGLYIDIVKFLLYVPLLL